MRTLSVQCRASAPGSPARLRLSRRLAASTALTGIALALAIVARTEPAAANPRGGTVVGGGAEIAQPAPGTVEIRQTTDKAIIEWQDFSIGEREHTRFQQPSAGSIALNRVVGGNPSEILGRLSANGQVWIVNPNGIVFGRDARVDVSGLVATTHDIRNEDFLAGRHRFEGREDGTATVENHGAITVGEAGLAALVAPGVSNTGTITARLGEVHLASGRRFVVDLYGDQRINLATDAPVKVQPKGKDGKPVDALVKNEGRIFADGGKVRLSAAAAKGIVDRVVDMSGVVQARTVEQRDGEIILSGGDEGTVRVSGTLDARGEAPGTKGGTAVVSGGRVEVATGARIDVSGRAGGGEALVGGDYLGGRAAPQQLAGYGIRPARKPVPNAAAVSVEAGASISADAIDSGRGGKAVVWSDGATRFAGAVSARGGATGGDGGFVETSGKVALRFSGTADTAAPLGRQGDILLDPANIMIKQSSPDLNGNGTTGDDITSAGQLDANADQGSADSVVTAAAVSSLLNGGTLTLSATGNIRFDGTGDAAITGHGTLRLMAGNSIFLYDGARIEGSGGGLSLLLSANADDGATGGVELRQASILSKGGSITFAGGADGSGYAKGYPTGSGDLLPNETSYGRGVRVIATTIDAGGGNIVMRGQGRANETYSVGIGIVSGSVVTTTGTGSITLDGIGGSSNSASGYSSGVNIYDGVKISTEQGALTIIGQQSNAGHNPYGISFDADPGTPSSIHSTSGPISFTATGTDASIVGTTPAGASKVRIGWDGTTTSASPLTFTADTVNLSATQVGQVRSSGQLTLQPSSPGKSIGVAGGAGAWSLSSAFLNALPDGFAGITIGRADGTGAVEVGSHTFKDPVTIRNPGGSADITVTGTLATGTGTEAGAITLQAGRSVEVNATGRIGTQNQPILLQARAGDGPVGDVWLKSGSQVTSSGGSILFSGSSDPLTGRAISAVGLSGRGVNLVETTVDAGGGSITMRGRGGNGVGTSVGVDVVRSVVQTSGSGTITLDGEAGNGIFFSGGISVYDGSRVSTSGTGAISLTGGRSGTDGAIGINMDSSNSATPNRLYSVGGGALILTAASSAPSVRSSDTGGTVEAQIGHDGTTVYASPITFTGDSIDLKDFDVRTSGAVAFQPANAATSMGLKGGAGTLQIGADTLSALAAGYASLTFGRSDGTGLLSIGAASFDHDIVLRSGGAGSAGISIGGALSVGANTLTLESGGPVTQSGAITAANLLLLGAGGTHTLTHAGNAVSTLAGNTGSVTYRDVNGFLIGTVNGTAGLTLNGGTLALTAGGAGAIGQTAALTNVGRLELSAGGAIDLDESGVANTVATLGAVARGGAFSLSDSAGGLTVDGAVGAAAGDVSIRTAGTLTFTANGRVAATGASEAVLAAIGGEFVNNRGADALSMGTGRWLIYAATRDGSTEGGLTGTREYSRSYAANAPATVARAGNVFLYGNTPLITVQANDASREYGDVNPSFSATYTGVLSGDDPALAHTGAAALTSAPQTAAVGTYDIDAAAGTLTSPTGYGFTFLPGTLTVTKAGLTVSANAQSKVYGDADPALGYSVGGLKLSDTAATVLAGGLYRAAGENVGRYAIGQGTLALTSGNYTLSFLGSSLEVTPAPLTVTAVGGSKVYGDADPALEYSVGGLKLSDTAATVLAGSLTRAAGENAGRYAIGLGTLAANANYTLGLVGKDLTITPAPLTATATDATKVYGDADPVLGYTLNGLRRNDAATAVMTGNPVRATGENAGTYAVGQGTLAANANYTLSFTGGNLSITRAPLTITADDLSRLYGRENPTLTGTPTGLRNGDTAAGLGVTYSTAATAASDVGAYAILPGVGALANYTVTLAPGTLTVTPAPLTVAAGDATRSVGGANPPFTALYEGFVLGQGPEVLGGNLGFQTAATAESVAGAYGVTPFGLSSRNYEIRFRPGTLTVEPGIAAPQVAATVERAANPVIVPPPVPGESGAAGLPTSGQDQGARDRGGRDRGAEAVSNSRPDAPGPAGAPRGERPAAMLARLASGGTAASRAAGAAATTAAAAAAAAAGPQVVTVGGRSVTYSPAAMAAHAAGQSLNQPSPALLASAGVRAAADRLLSGIGSGQMGTAMSSLSSMSTAEQRAAFQSIATAEMINGLINSDDPTARTVGALLQDTVSGGVAGYADVKAAVQAGGVPPALMKTYLALYQHVQREQRTGALGGALEALVADPAAADLFGRAGGQTPSVVKLDAPRDTGSGHKVVEGRIDQSARIREARVNGRWVFVDDQGRFTTNVPVQEGRNEVVLTVTDEKGEVVEKRIQVEADRATPPQTDAPRPGRKIALMIATDSYENPLIPALKTPASDVAAVGEALNERLGYETRVLKNPTKAEIIATLRTLGREVGEQDQVMLYYAGHGYEVAETGTGYWLPRDADADNPKNWVSNNDVARFLNRMPARQILVVSDSCYSGAFTREQKVDPSVVRNAPETLLGRRSVMAMSSGGDEPVADGDVNSPFAEALISRVRQLPRASGGYELFAQVRDDVTAEVPQTPQYGVIKAAGYDEGGDYLLGVKPAERSAGVQ